jgi:hypothetical protein
MLRHRNERDRVLVEKLDQLGEIRQRSGQAVNLIDDDDIDLAGANFGYEVLQGRAVERGAGKRAIVIAAGDQPPSLVRLAFDVRPRKLRVGCEAN